MTIPQGNFECTKLVDIFVSKKKKSAIREHALSCGVSVNIKNFKILESSNNKLSLLISESLYIKKLCPTLNSDISSVPLYIA